MQINVILDGPPGELQSGRFVADRGAKRTSGLTRGRSKSALALSQTSHKPRNGAING